MNKNKMIAEGLKRMNTEAVLAFQVKDYNRAIGIYDQVLMFENKLNFTQSAGETNVNIANIYCLSGNYDKALKALEEAERYFIMSKHDNGLYRVFQLKCEISTYQEKFAIARTYLEKCIKLNLNIKQNGDVQYQCAIVYKKENNLQKSVEHFSMALKIFEKIRDYSKMKVCLKQRSMVFLEMNKKYLATQDSRRLEQLNRITEAMSNKTPSDMQLAID